MNRILAITADPAQAHPRISRAPMRAGDGGGPAVRAPSTAFADRLADSSERPELDELAACVQADAAAGARRAVAN